MKNWPFILFKNLKWLHLLVFRINTKKAGLLSRVKNSWKHFVHRWTKLCLYRQLVQHVLHHPLAHHLNKSEQYKWIHTYSSIGVEPWSRNLKYLSVQSSITLVQHKMKFYFFFRYEFHPKHIHCSIDWREHGHSFLRWFFNQTIFSCSVPVHPFWFDRLVLEFDIFLCLKMCTSNSLLASNEDEALQTIIPAYFSTYGVALFIVSLKTYLVWLGIYFVQQNSTIFASLHQQNRI